MPEELTAKQFREKYGQSEAESARRSKAQEGAHTNQSVTSEEADEMDTEAARAPRVSIVRMDGERRVSAGLAAAEEALSDAKEVGADRIICEVSVITEANLRDE